MPKLKSVDFSEGATASRYFSNQASDADPKMEMKEDKPALPKKKGKVGRPKKAPADKSSKKNVTCYFEPDTIKKMDAFVKEKRFLNRSELIEVAVMEYMKTSK